MVANGAPILLRKLIGRFADLPVDFGKKFLDQKPLFGPAKTWRGIAISVFTTGLVAAALGYGYTVGIWLACFAMLGDLLSSFIKRRLGLMSSSRALFIDQIPESLLPALFLMTVFDLNLAGVILLVSCFIILEIILSKLLYRIGIRRRPY
jgi:CDP-2,3-bis-(O-geranylgeranyl)-sn-glycerol synthase